MAARFFTVKSFSCGTIDGTPGFKCEGSFVGLFIDLAIRLPT